MPTYPKINIVKYNRDVFLPVGNINTFGWECDDHKVFTISEDKEDLFRIIEEKLYIVKYPTVGSHNIIIKMSDLFNRYDPVERNFTFNVSLCDNCQTGYICVELEDDDGGDDGGGGDDDTGSDAGLSISATLGTVERVLAGHDIGSKLRPLDPEVVNDENVSQSTITIESDGSFNINSAESYLLNNDIDCIASGIDDRFIRNDFLSSCAFGIRQFGSTEAEFGGNRINLNGEGGSVIFNQNFKSTHNGQLFNLQIGSGLYLEAPTQETFNEVKLEYMMEFGSLVSPNIGGSTFLDSHIERFGIEFNDDGDFAAPDVFMTDVNGEISLSRDWDPNNLWELAITRNIPLRRIVDSANSYESDDITNLVNRTSNITPQKQATAASLLNVWGYDSNGQSKPFPRYDNDQNILINNFSFLVNSASSSEYKTSDNNAKNMFLDCARIQAVRSEYNNLEAVTDRTCWGTVKFFTASKAEPFRPNGIDGYDPIDPNYHVERPFSPDTVHHMFNSRSSVLLSDRYATSSATLRGLIRHRFRISGLGNSGLNIETPEIIFYEFQDAVRTSFFYFMTDYACEGGPGDDGIVPTPIRRDSATDVNNLVPTTAAPATTTTTPVTSTAAPATTAAPTTSAPTTAAPTTAAPTTAAPTTAAPTTAAPTTAAPTTAAPTTAAPTTSPPYNPPY